MEFLFDGSLESPRDFGKGSSDFQVFLTRKGVSKNRGVSPKMDGENNKNYFTSSNPHHDMLGEGLLSESCQHASAHFFLHFCMILARPVFYSV